MDTKTKILKILPFWLIFILLVTSLQVGISLAYEPSDTQKQEPIAAQEAPVPQVLGASTDLRGAADLPANQIVKIKEPDVSKISSKSFLVFDLTSGQELISKNPNIKLSIASLTKLMTGLVAYRNSDLNKTFEITNKDLLTVNPYLNLQSGDEVKALDIFNSMLIGSNNDAALALAHFTALETGKNFVELMNAESSNLGMSSSSFSNPMGFDSQFNYSTAEDLKILTAEVEKLSVFTDLGRRVSYKFSGQKKNYFTEATNKLINDYLDIQAIKTGSTPDAGEAMATKFKFQGKDIAIIVLASKDREGDTLKLKNEVETSFK